jgi:flagellar biosynthesis chaperone FliJ
MGNVMQLDADEAVKFWPVYKEFDTEYSTLGDQIVALIRTYVDNYDKMTDTVADQVATQILSIEQQRNELKKKYYSRMKNALDAVTAARFLQVENQLERLIDLQIAAQLPVVSEQ